MDEKMKDLLYRSFDSGLNPDEQKELEQALKKSTALRNEMQAVTALRKKLSETKNQSFTAFFAERVMQQLKPVEQIGPETLFYNSILQIFKPLAAAATIIIAIFISYNIAQTDSVSWESAFAVQEITLEEALDPSTSFNME